MYHEPPEDLEQLSDQKANPNLNANWVNMKGAWMIHVVIILLLKILYDIVPSISQETSWTMTNISYMFGSYLMFHYVRGVPFEFNAGAYDNLNMWEQIDNGDQYTPAKKFLLSVPICLFLVSTHYTHYDLTYFMINFMATVMVVVPKLPAVSLLLSPNPKSNTDSLPASQTPLRRVQRRTRKQVASRSSIGLAVNLGMAFGHASENNGRGKMFCILGQKSRTSPLDSSGFRAVRSFSLFFFFLL
jgi:hypothetical protein